MLSQEEIDAIMKEIKEEQNQLQFNNLVPGSITYNSPNITGIQPYVGIDWNYVSTKPEVNGNVCNHEWKEYVGLNHTDTYCTKCPAKK